MSHHRYNLLILIGLLCWICLWRKVHGVPHFAVRRRLGRVLRVREEVRREPAPLRSQSCHSCSWFPRWCHGGSLGAAQLVLGRQSLRAVFQFLVSQSLLPSRHGTHLCRNTFPLSLASSITGRFRCNLHCAEDLIGGMFGPVFLLAPLGLLALRLKSGRRLLLAALVFALPAYLNTGTRFLIPSSAVSGPGHGNRAGRRPGGAAGIGFVPRFRLLAGGPLHVLRPVELAHLFVSPGASPSAWIRSNPSSSRTFRTTP